MRWPALRTARNAVIVLPAGVMQALLVRDVLSVEGDWDELPLGLWVSWPLMESKTKTTNFGLSRATLSLDGLLAWVAWRA